MLLIALLSDDTRDVDESDQQQRERHRRRPEKKSPDHPNPGSVADQRSFRAGAAKQRADKFRRNQRHDTGKNAPEKRRRQRTADDVNEVAKEAHDSGLTSLVGKHVSIVGFQDIKHKSIRRKVGAIESLKRFLQVRRHIGHGDTT